MGKINRNLIKIEYWQDAEIDTQREIEAMNKMDIAFETLIDKINNQQDQIELNIKPKTFGIGFNEINDQELKEALEYRFNKYRWD